MRQAALVAGQRLGLRAERLVEAWPESRAVMAQVPTRVAVAIKQVPVKLAYGIRALADGDDNKDLLVGDVFPKAAAPPA